MARYPVPAYSNRDSSPSVREADGGRNLIRDVVGREQARGVAAIRTPSLQRRVVMPTRGGHASPLTAREPWWVRP